MGEATIDHLIINSPYEMPKSYWHYDREKRFFERKMGRRSAGYLSSSGTNAFDDSGVFHPLPLVNQIREQVDRWRTNNYEGIMGTTRKLLEYWRNPQERENRFFFCQLEAIETVIWLNEVYPKVTTDIMIPSDGGPYQRICSKMATGSGKTIVMGMAIAYYALNKVEHPEDKRFSKNFLVMAPGLTVKKRLQVLDPSAKNNIYQEFKIVPSSMFERLRLAKVIIHNWHALMPLEEHPKSVVKKGKESDEAFTRRILGSAHSGRDFIAINDEAHHAWRLPADMIAANAALSKEQVDEATRWMEGLDRIHKTRNILVCHDFSATPFIPTGKGLSEETLYEWIVSDFSLNDAIESGLVKTPRIAVRDDGRFAKDYHSRFYHIYADQDVKADVNRRAKPEEPLPDLIKNAYFALGNDWLETKKVWDGAKSPVPPVMITVCNRTETAARIEYSFKNNRFEIPELGDLARLLHIDSKVLKEAESKEEISEIGTPNVAANLKDENAPDIQVDADGNGNEDDDNTAGTMEDAASIVATAGGANALKLNREDRAEFLREQVDTVGKVDKPGQPIQNIIAVAMLSEGWDARTVTHIMGLRAFTSQLLCEQVVGRGLRRTSYEVDTETGLFKPEYVNVFGIPFTFLPVEGSSRVVPPAPKPTTCIEPYASKKQYQISWPNIIRIDGTFFTKLKLDSEKVEPLIINPEESSLIVDLAPVIDGKPHVDKISTIDIEKIGERSRLQTTIFKIARDLYEKFQPEWTGNQGSLLMQLVSIVEEFLQSDKLVIANTTFREDLRRRVLLTLNMSKIVQHIWNEIVDENTEETSIVYDTEKPICSTSDMMPWYTSKPVEYTKRSHISHAIIDSRWEQNAVFELDRNNGVEAWVKNDHLGFDISYTYNGVLQRYYPDFIIRLKNGLTLVLEIKGQDTIRDITKRTALAKWVKAVNGEHRFGMWASDVAFSPSEVKLIVNKHAEAAAPAGGTIAARCPLCHKSAEGRDEIERLFGYRNMDGFVRVQSWCRDCRTRK